MKWLKFIDIFIHRIYIVWELNKSYLLVNCVRIKPQQIIWEENVGKGKREWSICSVFRTYPVDRESSKAVVMGPVIENKPQQMREVSSRWHNWWHCCLTVSGTRVRSPPWVTVCVESARSSCVSIGFLRVLRFPPTVQKSCWLDALVMLNSPSVYPNRRQSVAIRGFSQ